MEEQRITWIWDKVWAWAGRVPLRAKIIGIVLAATCITDFGILFWIHHRPGDIAPDNSLASVGFAEPFAVIVIGMIVGLVIAWLLTGVLTYPIQQVTRVARQVDKGDFSCRAPVWADDEIGELGKTFNAMIDHLADSQTTLQTINRRAEERNKELTALYELADLAAQSTSADYVLSSGLSKIMKLINSNTGAVLLLNETGALSIQVGSLLPLSPHTMPSLHDLNEPLLWDVIQEGCPVVLSIDKTEWEQLPSPLRQAAAIYGGHTAFLIPMRTRNAVRGVLVIFGQNQKQEDEKITSLLVTMCNQLGVAFENTTLWEELKRKEEVRARLLAMAVTAQEQERERISRELHDETGQALTALLVQLKVLERLRDLDAIAAHAAELREIVLRTLEEVRRLARDLRPATLDDLGLIPTIEWHTRTFSQKTGLDIDFQTDTPEDFRLPEYTELVLYRVMQEALTNAARHASATRVRIRLVKQGDSVLFTMEDDGCGFDNTGDTQKRGVGLLGIQERVELIGGTLSIDSEVGRGTRLIVNVPIQERLATG